MVSPKASPAPGKSQKTPTELTKRHVVTKPTDQACAQAARRLTPLRLSCYLAERMTEPDETTRPRIDRAVAPTVVALQRCADYSPERAGLIGRFRDYMSFGQLCRSFRRFSWSRTGLRRDHGLAAFGGCIPARFCHRPTGKGKVSRSVSGLSVLLPLPGLAGFA